MSQPGKCKSCGASIIWIKTKSANLMPIDAAPVEGGNIAILDDTAHTISGKLFDDMIEPGPRYVTHFATCPGAAHHRKRKE